MSCLSCDLEWRSKSSDWQRWDRHLVGLPSQQTWWALIETFSEIITHLLFSWLRFVWPWSQVKVMLIITWCIRMFEAVPVPSVMMMTSIIFEESLARDRQTHTDTASSMLTFFQSLKTLGKKEKKKKRGFAPWRKLSAPLTYQTRPWMRRVTSGPLPFPPFSSLHSKTSLLVRFCLWAHWRMLDVYTRHIVITYEHQKKLCRCIMCMCARLFWFSFDKRKSARWFVSISCNLD